MRPRRARRDSDRDSVTQSEALTVRGPGSVRFSFPPGYVDPEEKNVAALFSETEKGTEYVSVAITPSALRWAGKYMETIAKARKHQRTSEQLKRNGAHAAAQKAHAARKRSAPLLQAIREHLEKAPDATSGQVAHALFSKFGVRRHGVDRLNDVEALRKKIERLRKSDATD